MGEAILVAGLGFGDEGKGSIVDFLTRNVNARTIVRYNGGAQAAHNVVLPDGRHHTFAQFGSGMFVPGVSTYLSKYMLVNPDALVNEAAHLSKLGVDDVWSRLFIDGEALITNPFQIAANRFKEIVRNTNRHGSCGMGIGETMADSLDDPDPLKVEDLGVEPVVRMKLARSRDRKIKELRGQAEKHRGNAAAMRQWAVLTNPETLDICVGRYLRFLSYDDPLGWWEVESSFLQGELDTDGTLIFEGAQGVLLDQDFGFHPYTTWSDTTFGNAYKLLEGFDGPVSRLGVIRAYATRHGAGPFVTEDKNLELPDLHNGWGEWQQDFRVGHFDLLALDYALRVIGGVDGLALTCMDRIGSPSVPVKVCTQYELPDGRVWDHIPKVATPGGSEESLSTQEALGRTLMAMKPCYEEVWDDYFAEEWVQNAVGVPVGILSNGPTAEDKVSIGGWRGQVRETAAAV